MIDIKDRKDISTLDKIRLVVDKMVPDLGFEKMTIRDICSEVGITVGTFYHYFQSKDDLMFDRYVRTQEYFEELYDKKLKSLDEVDALKLFFLEYIDYNKSRVYPIFKEFELLLIKNSTEWSGKHPRSISKILTSLVEKGQTNGSIRKDYNKEDMVLFFNIISQGITSEYLFSGGDWEDTSGLEQLIGDNIENIRNK